MILELATVDKTASIGEGTVIWQYATVCANVKIGPNCVIGSCAWIGQDAEIGEGTRIQHGVFIAKGTIIGKNVFLGPNVTTSDDPYPRVRQSYTAMPAVIDNGASIGAGAIILPGVRIGERAMIGAGAVVTHNVMPGEIVVGIPARPLR